MNVWTLREIIKDLPDDLIVVTRWYEDWFDDSHSAWVIEIKIQEGASWYNWKYTYWDDTFSNTQIIKALSI